MSMSTRTTEVLMTAQTPDGFKVAKVSRERYGNNRAPMFSAGVETYTSRRAFEIGAEWQSWDHDLSAFPILAPIALVSGNWTDNGEPLHGPANAWYRLSGADMANEIDGIERFPARKNYYNAPAHRSDYDHLSPDFAAYFVDMAASCLGVTVDELPNVQDEALFTAWVDSYARPLWQARADAANELIDHLSATTPAIADPSDDDNDDVTISLGSGDELISVRTWQPTDKPQTAQRGDGWHYSYSVLVRACGTTYSTTFGGSIADYEDDKHDARGGCNCVLRELFDALNYSTGDEWARDMGMEEYDRKTVKALDRCIAAAKRMRVALEANADAIGG